MSALAITIEDAPAVRGLPAPVEPIPLSSIEVTDERGRKSTATCHECGSTIAKATVGLVRSWATGHRCRPDETVLATTRRPVWAFMSRVSDDFNGIDHIRPASRPVVLDDDVLTPTMYCYDQLVINGDGTTSTVQSEPRIEIADSTTGRATLSLEAARALRDDLTELLLAVTA